MSLRQAVPKLLELDLWSPMGVGGGAVPTVFTVWLTDLRGNPIRRAKISLTKFNCDPLSIKARQMISGR